MDRDYAALERVSMQRRSVLATAPTLLAASLLGGCGAMFPKRENLRFRVTVTTDTPSGSVSGSSVLENRNEAGAGGSLRLVQNPRAECFGEAVVVNLGEGRVIFAVREDAYVNRRMYEMVEQMLAYPASELQPPLPSHPSRGDWGTAYPEARRVKPVARIHRAEYPLLVTFADLHDHTTIKEVDPNDLGATFGPGYRLDGLTVQVTDDPVTDGVVTQWLPWLTPLNQPFPLKGLHKAADPIAHLGKHAFKYMSY